MLKVKDWIKQKNSVGAQFIIIKESELELESARRLIDDVIFYSVLAKPHMDNYYYHRKTSYTIKSSVGIARFHEDLINVTLLAYAHVIEKDNIRATTISHEKIEINDAEKFMKSELDTVTQKLIRRLNNHRSSEEAL